MTTPPLLLQIRSKRPSYNNAFRKIADYFLKRGTGGEYIQISEVARCSQVSKATVTRFIQDLGYSSYKSFQMDMARAALQEQTGAQEGSSVFGYSGITQSDSTVELCRKVFASNIQALQDTLSLIDVDVIEQLAEKVLNCRRLVFLAAGRSQLAAHSGRLRIARLGIICDVYSDPHEQVMASVLLDSRDVVIGISAFGRSVSVIRCMQRAKDHGAFVVGITSYQQMPIEKAANRMLYASTSDPLFYSAEPSCTTGTHVAILDCLYMMLVMRTFGGFSGHMMEGAEAMEEERCKG